MEKIFYPGGEYLRYLEKDWTPAFWPLPKHDRLTNVNKISSEPGFNSINTLEVSPANPSYVGFCSNSDMLISKDGGITWEYPMFDYGEAFKPGKFGKRPPSPFTHKMRARGVQMISANDIAVDPYNRNTIAIGHADVGLRISRDNGKWWEWGYDGLSFKSRHWEYCRSVVYDPTVKNRMYISTGKKRQIGEIYRSDDGGKSFYMIGIKRFTQKMKRIKNSHNGKEKCKSIWAGNIFEIVVDSLSSRTPALELKGWHSFAHTKNDCSHTVMNSA